MEEVRIIRADKDQHVSIVERLVKEYSNESHRDLPQEFTNESFIRINLGSFSDPSKYFEFFLAIKTDENEDINSLSIDYDKCIGCIMYNKTFTFDHGRFLTMHNLYVKKLFRNHGLGLALIKQLMRVAKEEDAVIRFITNSNNPAIGWYQKLGATILFTDSRDKTTLTFERDAIHKMLASG